MAFMKFEKLTKEEIEKLTDVAMSSVFLSQERKNEYLTTNEDNRILFFYEEWRFINIFLSGVEAYKRIYL